MIEFRNPEGPVLVIGAAGLDIVGRATDVLEAKTSNPGRLRISHGGVARNVAENLAHLGTDTILLTAVGDDAQGQRILERARREGVNVEAAVVDPGHPTGAYLAVLDRQGNLQHGLDDMAVLRSLTPAELESRQDLFAEAAVIMLDANLPPSSLDRVFELASAHGVPVAADPTSRSLAPRVKPYLESIWLLSPNEPEAEVLCPLSIPHTDEARAIEAARHLVSRGIDFVMITRAEFGVGYATSEGSGHVPAVQTEIIDPTGAGDALLATVIFALLNEIPVDEAVKLGTTAASLTLRCPDSVVQDLSLEMLYDQLV